jgi:hypothetical protein
MLLIFYPIILAGKREKKEGPGSGRAKVKRGD